MRKDLGAKTYFMPLPVAIIGTYDENGIPNAMNAAWAGIYDFNQVFVSLSEHKTTENFMKTGAFTLSFATKKTVIESDYFGIVSGSKENKIEKAHFHSYKSDKVNAPLFEEYPLTLECEVESFIEGNLIGNIINVSVDEEYLKDDGSIDIDAMEIITFDSVSNTYRVLGETVGHAFKDGKKI
ncbi:MAG: flavin reductase family protein [Erysipelotrichaceae bacterium]|nr:flavin reductase family protein [Erysipelotrichaceae bacterium]